MRTYRETDKKIKGIMNKWSGKDRNQQAGNRVRALQELQAKRASTQVEVETEPFFSSLSFFFFLFLFGFSYQLGIVHVLSLLLGLPMEISVT